MRTSLRNQSEVAHYWGNQIQSEGRANHIFFEGKSIFSYGRHFEIARFANSNAVFFNPRRYSSTTCQHQSLVRHAIPANVEVFQIDGFDNSHSENIKQLLDKVTDLRAKACRARLHKNFYLMECKNLIAKIEKYLEIFHCKSELSESHIKLIDSFRATKDNLLSEETVKAIREQQEKERQEKIRECKQKIQDWLSFKINHIPALDYVYLRIRDGIIESSRGARVRLESARMLWDKIKAGEPVRGIQVDNFTVISMTDTILQIGCHKIEMIEVYRLAKALNW
ncbi:MAG TPA: hypothetical protein DET40_18475 [Lentisphaeria bacterium]|nr:MAG: hypothetical protein A2X45_14615 [Lentisphaerae bacterium GWF2_50_93]HCE45530.1 hypothetical protein [Lentisphaeria bacterium]